MLRLIVDVVRKSNNKRLGTIEVELSKVNYAEIIEYALPKLSEEIEKRINSSNLDERQKKSLLNKVLFVLMSKREFTYEAIRNAINAFPDDIKEELIVTICGDKDLVA